MIRAIEVKLTRNPSLIQTITEMISVCANATVGFGISPNQPGGLADCTAGGESHPAPKNKYYFDLRLPKSLYGIIIAPPSVSCKYYFPLSFPPDCLLFFNLHGQ